MQAKKNITHEMKKLEWIKLYIHPDLGNKMTYQSCPTEAQKQWIELIYLNNKD